MSVSEEKVRLVLEEICDTYIKYFTLVLILEDQTLGSKKYMCLCKRSFFLVDQNLKNRTQTYYGNINEIHVHAEHPELLAIHAREKPILYVKSPVRFELMNFLQILWKTDYMTRFKRVGNFPLNRDKFTMPEKLQSHTTVEANIIPTPDTSVHSAGNYQFLLENEYSCEGNLDAESELLRYREEIHNNYSKQDGQKLHVWVRLPQRVLSVSRRDAYTLQIIAENIAVEELGLDSDYVILASRMYPKKGNVSGDLASWRCHQVHIRCKSHDIGVIIARRKYIPPSADTSRDVCFILTGPPNRFQDTDELLGPLRTSVDSLTANQQSFYFDELLVKTRVEALSCDEETMSWFSNNLTIHPTFVNAVKALIKSIAFFLYNEKLEIDAEQMYPETPLFEDFFEIIVDIEGDYQARTGDKSPAENRNWRRKVARYIAHCIDGGLVVSLSIEDLVVCARQATTTQKGLERVHKLIDYLVYMKPKDDNFEFQGLPVKIANRNILLSSTMNERVVCRLLQLKYFERLLTPLNLYHTFLILLLEKGGSLELMNAVCTQISFACANPENTKKIVDAGVLAPLMKLFEIRDDFILQSATKVLVNITANMSTTRDALLREYKTIPLILPNISRRNAELATYCAKLIKNCIHSDENRTLVASAGAIAPLLDLLRIGIIPNVPVDEALMTAVGSAIWNLAMETATALQLRNHGAVQILSELVKAVENENIIEKVAGGVMAIAAKSRESRSEFADVQILEPLMKFLLNSSSKAVLKTVLGALFHLSKEPTNAKSMVRFGIHAGLNRAISILGESSTDMVEKFRAILEECQ
eukprot:TRINITY_DN6820_c0_g2_i1.p1 TRINITY_DN6820_c0_g2~~TRINITY_DN6820_c0_g2_i1.p1  ORF type:complete len:815 (+),score=163.51 TRINITY_DN6820_c0_g2_i1:50-2494(+)